MRQNVSGRFEVTIAVNGEDAAVKSLLEKYELNLTKRMLVVQQDTLSVTYHVKAARLVQATTAATSTRSLKAVRTSLRTPG